MAVTTRPCAAHHHTDAAHRLEPVVVSATRSPLAPQDVAANITVITASQLEQMPATTVAEALAYVPGIFVEFNGGPGSDAGGIRIQGSETHHVAVFKDGVPLNQMVNPRTDLNILSLGHVERIEIYKGAASSAWGSALGGVINIITKPVSGKGPLTAEMRALYGSHQTLKSSAMLTGAPDPWGWLLSYAHERSDGFREHTGYDLDNVYAKFEHLLDDGQHLDLALSYSRKRNSDPVLNSLELADESFWDDIKRRQSYQRLRFESPLNPNTVLTLEGRHRQADVNVEDVFARRRETFVDYTEELWGVSARLDWQPVDTHALVAGIDADWGRFEWDPFEDPRRRDHVGDRAFFASDTLRRGALTLNAGVRYDDNFDHGSALSPSLGATYRWDRLDTRLRAQVAKGFSAPNYAWVHDPTYGNPHLKPEHVDNYQLGIEIQPLTWLSAQLNLFKAKVNDLIRFDNTRNNYQNIDRVTRQGFEWSLVSRPLAGLAFIIGGSHTDVRDDATHMPIDDIPRTQYNLSLQHTKGGMSHSLSGKYADHNSSYAETKDKVFVFDYLFKINLPSDRMKGTWSLYGAIYNIFDTTHIVREVWPQPGRRGEAGILFRFNNS